jgi:hypothetical protein
MMRVWVVETGMYEHRGVAGVYRTLEAAMRAHPAHGKVWRWTGPGIGDGAQEPYVSDWRLFEARDPDGPWENGMPGDLYAVATPMELKE